MPYKLQVDDYVYIEPNKDELIDRLTWLLRQHMYVITVTYPDGSEY